MGKSEEAKSRQFAASCLRKQVKNDTPRVILQNRFTYGLRDFVAPSPDICQ